MARNDGIHADNHQGRGGAPPVDPGFTTGTMIFEGQQAQGGRGAQGAAGARRVALPPAIAAGLSPEMLLAYMRGNLEGLDDQIAGALAEMNARRQRTGQLSDILNRLRDLKQDAANLGRPDGGAHNDGIELRTERDGRTVKTEGNHEIRDLLHEAGLSDDEIQELVGEWGDCAHADEIETAIQRVSDEIGQLNNLNEYETLQINDLMSKRSQLIQMVSKMMANMDETAKAVIQNMR